MAGAYITTLTKANTMSDSLRTTVPSSIAKHYDLKNGDKLGWYLRPEGDRILVIVMPMKNVVSVHDSRRTKGGRV